MMAYEVFFLRLPFPIPLNREESESVPDVWSISKLSVEGV